MMSDDSEHAHVGRITAGLSEGALVEKTIVFVRERLPEWRDDPDRPDEESEDRLNLQLCKFLDARARSDFAMVSFHHEEPQTGRRKVDVSASPAKSTRIGARQYTIYEPFLVLEGKRLPAPSASREYVTGQERRSGGVQRFKLGLHGAAMSVAAIIGYIQGQSSTHWHQVIKRWISDLAAGRISDVCPWDPAETLGHLEHDAGNGTAVCESVHDRSGDAVGTSIRLHHLWVEMKARKTRR